METLLVGILVPIVVGPLSIYLKSLWDRYNEKKDNILRNRYETKINILDKKINSFYWPVYLKLKCLYRLNYKYHINKKPINIVDQESTNPKRSKYSDTSDDNYNIRDIIEGKTLIKKKIRKKRKKKDLKWDDYPDTFNGDNMKIDNSPSTTDIDFLNDESSMSSDSDETKHKKILVEVEDIFLTEIDKKVINLSKEIKNLIETNISIIQPNEKLINEIIKFVRFTEMEIIVFNVNNKNINRKYNYTDMGVVNNTKTLYKMIEEELFKSIEEYNNTFYEFNNLNRLNIAKIRNCLR